jgi:hypothetical protein
MKQCLITEVLVESHASLYFVASHLLLMHVTSCQRSAASAVRCAASYSVLSAVCCDIMCTHNRLLETGLLEGLEFGDVMVDELAGALEVCSACHHDVMMCTRYISTHNLICIAFESCNRM